MHAHPLNQLTEPEGVALLEHLGVHGRRSELAATVKELAGHALSLTLLGTWLDAIHGGDITAREQLSLADIIDEPADFIGDQTKRFAKRAARIMEGYVARFAALEGGATNPGMPSNGSTSPGVTPGLVPGAHSSAHSDAGDRGGMDRGN